ncbi:MAG: LysM peptidoglycan-binding domain-containing protein, partial [Thermodesulfobacteriota bacterium]|nr:LysM peptidoglycan-binding domain-containing protein [Thermodesulfobacteriota bacterium]
ERISQPYRMKPSDDDLIVEDDHFDKETAYESWQESTMTGGTGFFRRYWVLLALLILALLGLYIYYSATRPKSNTVRLSQATILDSRIDELELRFSSLEEKTPETDQTGKPGVQMEVVDRISDRMDRLEGSFKTWMEEMTAKMEAVQKETSAQKPVTQKQVTRAPVTQKTVAQKPVTKPKKQVSTEKKEAKVVPKTEKQTSVGAAKTRYHTVQSDETLYRLSVKYGLPVDRIKELNQLSNNIIKPGQKLRVSP